MSSWHHNFSLEPRNVGKRNLFKERFDSLTITITLIEYADQQLWSPKHLFNKEFKKNV